MTPGIGDHASKTKVVRALIVSAAVLATVVPAHGASVEVERGRLDILSPHSSVRTVAVLTGIEHVDGFFFPVSSEPGTYSTVVVENRSGTPVDLVLNWFRRADPPPWLPANPWLSQCATPETPRTCTPPGAALQGEVTGPQGRDIDVAVLFEPAAG